MTEHTWPTNWPLRGTRTGLALKYENGKLRILDQRLLPREQVWLDICNGQDAIEAIQTLAVRGAPLIGSFGALAAVATVTDWIMRSQCQAHYAAGLSACSQVRNARPTAVNLAHDVDRILQAAPATYQSSTPATMKILNTLESEALKIWDEYVASDQAIAENGASSLSSIVFTHCNAGSLATPGVGTALGVVKAAFQQGQVKHVFVDETRPLLQGARLTATELRAEGISHTVICDNMAAAMLREQTLFHGASAVTVIVGADRIAADGSVANKIGTYSLAVAAHYHGVKFLVAAPNSTIDPNCATGSNIEIEERSQSEVLAWAPVIQKQDKSPLAPKVLSRVRNPAFDVTPSELINGIITENGVFTPEDILRSLQ